MVLPLIEAKNMSRDYLLGDTTVHALREVDLEIYEGEFVAIMGPSGSGKSTAMNLIFCLDTLTSRQFLFEGSDISNFTSDELATIRNEKIGFVFQSFNLLARTTAKDNVQLPLLYSGTPRADRVRVAENVLKEVGLGLNTVDQVLLLAELCQSEGLNGVVCSANELSILRKHLKEERASKCRDYQLDILAFTSPL